jgi:hypothetical protein
MNTLLQQKYISYPLIVLMSLFAFFFALPSEADAACQLENGQFRNADYQVNFSDNWFENAMTETGSQPFIYLDMDFSDDCIGNSSISFSVREYDTIDANGLAVGPLNIPTITSETTQQTQIFTAGDSWCDVWYLGGYGCEYFLFLEIDGQEYNYYQAGESSLSIEYSCYGDCWDQQWAYVGTAHDGNTEGYTYGGYESSNDPTLGPPDSQGGQGDGDAGAGTQGDGDVGTGTQEDAGILVGGAGNLEDIENPLGDGSNLPAFIESLLGIIVRAGIPLVVLALVYTGFRFVEARGNPEKITDAKRLLLYTVIGTAILLGAWTIATILTNTINAVISSVIIYIV